MRQTSRKMCDREMVAAFDYSRLSDDFAKLSKPAQRALLSNGIATPSQLAKHSLKEIRALHGIGPSSVPILRKALQKRGLKFRA